MVQVTNLIGRKVIFNGDSAKVTDQPEQDSDLIRIQFDDEELSLWLRVKDVDILPE